MNVIRHHDPCLYPVLTSVVFEHDCFDEMGEAAATQPTFAKTAIEPAFEFSALRGCVSLLENRFKCGMARDGERIVKLKRDELGDTRRVEVRQITALMPPAKTFAKFFQRGFP